MGYVQLPEGVSRPRWFTPQIAVQVLWSCQSPVRILPVNCTHLHPTDYIHIYTYTYIYIYSFTYSYIKIHMWCVPHELLGLHPSLCQHALLCQHAMTHHAMSQPVMTHHIWLSQHKISTHAIGRRESLEEARTHR